MRNFAITIIILFLIVFSFSVQADTWTILIYGASDNGSEVVQILNFNLAETIGSDTEMNIVIELDRWDGQCDPETRYDDDISNGNWTGARKYLITQDTESDTINSTLLQDLGEIDTAEQTSLENFLIWGSSVYPADHYVLFAVGYGYGWIGAFMDRDSCTSSNCSGCDGHYMQLDEIRDSLASFKAAVGKNLDILFFDTCLMMNYEVIYTLSPYVDIIIGSEELATDENDMGTDKFLENLKNDKNISPEQLAIQIVNTKPSAFNTLSAVKTADITILNRSFNKFIRELCCNDFTYRSDVMQDISANYVTRFGHFPNRFADLYHLVYLVTHRPEASPGLITSGEDLLARLDDTIIANTYTSGVKDNSFGISIYFPVKAVVDGLFVDYNTEKQNYNNLSFSDSNLWDQFIPDSREDDSDDLCNRADEQINLKIIPNPGRNADFIRFSGLKFGDSVMIFDISGHKVFETTLKEYKAGIDLDCREFSSGIYIIQVKRNDKITLKKMALIN